MIALGYMPSLLSRYQVTGKRSTDHPDSEGRRGRLTSQTGGLDKRRLGFDHLTESKNCADAWFAQGFDVSVFDIDDQCEVYLRLQPAV